MRVFMLERPPEGLELMDGVAVKPGTVQSMEELRLAHHLAKRSFDTDRNIARIFKYEFLLWLSGTRDIKNALKKTAPEGRCLLILFSGDRPEGAQEAAGLPEDADPIRLEGISLSRVRG
jgi:hypothetical protein